MKFEWRKHEKALYGAKSIPALVDIPTQNFIMIKEAEILTTRIFQIG